MQNAQHEERRHGIIQHLAIRSIQLRNCRQREGEGYVLKKVDMRTSLEQQWVRVGIGGLRARICRVVAVADVLVLLYSVVYHPVGEVDKVGGKWERPGAGDCWSGVRNMGSPLGGLGKKWSLTQHLGDGNPDSEG